RGGAWSRARVWDCERHHANVTPRSTSPLGACRANSRQVRSAAKPYATTSVTMFAVKPPGPSCARIAPERIAPTAFAALQASAKTAFAPARPAGVHDESWKAIT